MRHLTLQTAFALTLLLTANSALADPGLLLVAHGSPDPRWNQPVLELGRRVAAMAATGSPFKAVRTAMLEAVKPDIPTAIAELESAGCDRIIAVPLFVAQSGHTHFDVPAALGIYSSPKSDRLLAEEGLAVLRPRVPIVVTSTLSEGDLLRGFALAEIQKLSKTPGDEAIVLLAHGDPEHHLLVDRLMREVTTWCCGRKGISYGDWAFIGVGQEYPSHGIGAIKAALDQKKRVLVVGLYVSTSAAKIHQRSLAGRRHQPAQADPLQGRDVAFSEGSLIEHPDFPRRVLETALAAAKPAPARQATPLKQH